MNKEDLDPNEPQCTAFRQIERIGATASHPDVRRLAKSIEQILVYQFRIADEYEEKIETLEQQVVELQKRIENQVEFFMSKLGQIHEDVGIIAATQNIEL